MSWKSSKNKFMKNHQRLKIRNKKVRVKKEKENKSTNEEDKTIPCDSEVFDKFNKMIEELPEETRKTQ